MTSAEAEVLGRKYAQRVLVQAGVADDARLAAAFATVPRQSFLGPPPWWVRSLSGGYSAPTDDPEVIYDDVLVALDASRGINNGSPSLHARAIHALSPQPGETVVHIGAGTGYYSAILSRMVGESGHVTAVEYDPALAERADICLRPYANADLVQASGSDWPQKPCDIVYVNFATDRPAERWVDMLKPGGRLLFPLGVPAETPIKGSVFSARAGYLLVTATEAGYAAHFIQGVSFIWAVGLAMAGRDSQDRLNAAFRKGGGKRVRGLRWKMPQASDEWFSDTNWGLTFSAPGAEV
ncbi:methyltransferase domain-containing protein [Rhizobium sp. CG5]|uniref:protein-L-isoaspartate O-methyltransferase family protein n=1 Tax=Rhizobium sp. CG5 TaxID=2726076 RepID=UPI0020332FB8